MRIFFALIMSFWVLSSPGFAQSAGQVKDLVAAFEAFRAGDWPTAVVAARRSGALAEDLMEWHRLRKGLGTFAEYQAFLTHNGDWPGLPLLQRKGEAVIPRDADPQTVVTYFKTLAPQSGVGALRLAAAYTALGHKPEAESQLILAWRSFSLSENERAAFVARHGALLKSHNEARLDMLLWRGLSKQAEAMFPLVSDGWARLAKARIGLRKTTSGVDALIKAVPAKNAGDAGLAFERFQWRARKGRNDSAIELMLAQSTSAEALGQPSRWASWRRSLARQKMRAGEARTAYRLAASHFLDSGSSYSDLEWLAGYIALRYLEDPATALKHFQRFRVAVNSPISLGRAGYWEGRAHEALGDYEAASIAFAFGAEYQTSFYGQLAAERVGARMDPALTGAEVFPAWQSGDFTSSSVFQSAMLLQKAGETALARRFFLQVGETQSRIEHGQLAALALELNEINIALMLAKQAARMGHVLNKAYYPLHDLAKGDLPIAPELALSIARRESEFNPAIVSPAGARGLMQLMPRTAKEVAGNLGEPYSQGRLLTDWGYNARLGSAYLAELSEEFGNNPVLLSVAYNAGPSRARAWTASRGDPRTPGVDIIDWIEHIPFRETRNYVMRVSESLPAYRARLSGKTGVPELSKELAQR